uniref:Helicase C-terminal domain-containing protein n=1 Tax=Helicotheca tamesis TaxID=374047 RepID=A0A7S2HEN4_9STRA
MIEVLRRVSGASGLGESSSSTPSLPQKSTNENDTSSTNTEGYVLVCNEDSVRGLHLDGLDYVIVVGRPRGPDEYTHIAGRTGRAGKRGTVVNVVSFEQAAALTSWEKMLDVEFIPLDEEEVMEEDF